MTVSPQRGPYPAILAVMSTGPAKSMTPSTGSRSDCEQLTCLGQATTAGGPRGQASASGMLDDDDAAEIEMVFTRDSADMVYCRSDIEVRCRVTRCHTASGSDGATEFSLGSGRLAASSGAGIRLYGVGPTFPRPSTDPPWSAEWRRCAR